MNLQEWDRLKVGEYLQCIGVCYAHIAAEASKMQWALENLPVRPAWETLARDNLNKLETMLRVLLAETQKMQREYDNLPVILEHYTRDSFSHYVGTENEDEQLRYETERGTEHA